MRQQQELGTPPLVAEVDLGRYHLFCFADQRIDLASKEAADTGVSHVFSLDPDETYRLLTALHTWWRGEKEEERVL